VVLATAVPLIRARRRESSRDALGAGVGAIVYATVSCLFDAMSFPHVPYIFLTLAGLVAVLWQQKQVEATSPHDRTALHDYAVSAESPAERPLRPDRSMAPISDW
jgi:hypothetical protein